MKTAGIIGGIGPESTIEYYRRLVDSYRRRQREGEYPHLFINSINMKRMLDLLGVDNLAGLTDYLADELGRLARVGADFGAIASNTPHIVFDELRRRSSIPLISIVETACERAKQLGLKRVALLGTHFTMQGAFYPAVFSRAGITLVTPDLIEQAYVHDKYMDELVEGVILEETRRRFLHIVEALRKRDAIEGVVLGGTELPLLLREEPEGLLFLNTTQIHVDRIVEELLS
jgi:aspartate racemase